MNPRRDASELTTLRLNIGDKTYLRIPYIFHNCGIGSKFIGSMTILELELKDDKYYIKNTDVCKYDNGIQMYQNRYNGPLKYYKSTQDKGQVDDSYEAHSANSLENKNVNVGDNMI